MNFAFDSSFNKAQEQFEHYIKDYIDDVDYSARYPGCEADSLSEIEQSLQECLKAVKSRQLTINRTKCFNMSKVNQLPEELVREILSYLKPETEYIMKLYTVMNSISVRNTVFFKNYRKDTILYYWSTMCNNDGDTIIPAPPLYESWTKKKCVDKIIEVVENSLEPSDVGSPTDYVRKKQAELDRCITGDKWWVVNHQQFKRNRVDLETLDNLYRFIYRLELHHSLNGHYNEGQKVDQFEVLY
jgi:hypothetical protein